jgi:hypothetical protein
MARKGLAAAAPVLALIVAVALLVFVILSSLRGGGLALLQQGTSSPDSASGQFQGAPSAPPPPVRLAELVVGKEAAAWALVPVPEGRIPRHVLLPRPPAGRISVWSVEGDEPGQPVLTVLLRPGEGEAAAARLGPLPSYHAARQILVVVHQAGNAAAAAAGPPAPGDPVEILFAE